MTGRFEHFDVRTLHLGVIDDRRIGVPRGCTALLHLAWWTEPKIDQDMTSRV
jgi:hypothetical protein